MNTVRVSISFDWAGFITHASGNNTNDRNCLWNQFDIDLWFVSFIRKFPAGFLVTMSFHMCFSPPAYIILYVLFIVHIKNHSCIILIKLIVIIYICLITFRNVRTRMTPRRLAWPDLMQINSNNNILFSYKYFHHLISYLNLPKRRPKSLQSLDKNIQWIEKLKYTFFPFFCYWIFGSSTFYMSVWFL